MLVLPKFTDPAGRTIPPAGETRFRGNVVELRRRHRQSGLEISPETTVPRWDGETMDYNMAIEAMLRMESPISEQMDPRDEP